MANERPGILKQLQKMFVKCPAGNRKTRSVDFAYSSIPLQRGATVNLLLHKHMNGYILIELNKCNEPVRTWRDSDGFFPIRRRKIDTRRIAEIVFRIDPLTLYLNDGAPLVGLFRKGNINKSTRYEPYTGSLVDEMARVLRVIDDPIVDAYSKISYRDAVSLDPNITYREYCLIYGPSTFVEAKPGDRL